MKKNNGTKAKEKAVALKDLKPTKGVGVKGGAYRPSHGLGN